MFSRTTGRVDRRRCKAKNDSCLLLNQIANTTDHNLSMEEILGCLKLTFAGFPHFLFRAFFLLPMRLLLLCFYVF